PSLNGRFFIAF
ncbi:araC-type transcriptional regulator family protein, partial [Vibrio parahaemolyticus V-223/04]